mgnify:CR=1 FL=1
MFLKAYPLSTLTSILTIVLLVGFLITSVDSAIYVLSMFTDKGKQNPKKTHRLVWAILMFIFTEAILLLGSFNAEIDVLTAMQKLLIVTSLPFALLSVFKTLLNCSLFGNNAVINNKNTNIFIIFILIMPPIEE